MKQMDRALVTPEMPPHAIELQPVKIPQPVLFKKNAKKKILLIGNSRSALEMAANINRVANDCTVVGCVRLNGRGEQGGEETGISVPVLGNLTELAPFMELIPLNVNTLIVADSEIRHHQMLRIMTLARKSGVDLWTVPQLTSAFLGGLKFFNFHGHPIVRIRANRIHPLQKILKTVLDYSAAVVGLVLCAPVMAATALLIKLTSPGPVLFRQTRVGKNGRLFNVIKFRSMFVDAEKQSGPMLSPADDRRVTPLGRILRKTHVDELPQFFNVLNGTMSMVGPRPERPYFIEGFAQCIPFYSDRLAVKPGITGLAQVYGSYHSKAEEKLIFDLNYIQNCSLLLDIKICVLSVWQAGKNLLGIC